MVRFIHVRATRLAPALQTTAVRNRATRSCRRTPGSSRWVLTGTRGIVLGHCEHVPSPVSSILTNAQGFQGLHYPLPEPRRGLGRA